MANKKRVLVVGSARESGGGVSSVIKSIEKMPVWNEYNCYWLGTQIQRNYLWKLWYAMKANFMALFIIWKFDIVHFHTVPDRICLVIQLPVFLFACIGRKKIIMHVHMGNQLRNHTGNKLFLWCLKRADRIVLLANKWKDLFEKEYKGVGVEKKGKLQVVYNAAPEVSAISYDERRKFIMFCGYLDDNKACDILLKAFVKVREKHPDWYVEVLGNGDVERFKKISDELGLGDFVKFEGYVSGAQKLELFQHASIHCLCSYVEGFPMVVLEAWSYGTPVISTPVGGLPDVIEENKNCCTFGFGDVDGLVNKLNMLIEDKKLRQEMSEFEQKFVAEKFSSESINERLENLYVLL